MLDIDRRTASQLEAGPAGGRDDIPTHGELLCAGDALLPPGGAGRPEPALHDRNPTHLSGNPVPRHARAASELHIPQVPNSGAGAEVTGEDATTLKVEAGPAGN
jgi:hypothetical protein